MPHTWGPKSGLQPVPTEASPAQRARVLFVCIGNSCRSQMAEGFALSYGKDVMEVASAGLSPAGLVWPLSRKVMLETKSIDLSEHWPKSLGEVPGPFDLIVNISGLPLPPGLKAKEVRAWAVEDPVLGDESVHIKVANQIESLVQQLILDLRQRKH